MANTVTLSAMGTSVTMSPEEFDRLTDEHVYPVPSDETFEQEDAEFLPGFDLEKIGKRLLDDCPELRFLTRYPVAYIWRRAGSVSNQKQVLGKCSKTAGKLRHFAKVIYVVEIAADHCRDAKLTNRQMEALIYHELSHPIELMDDKGNIKPAIVGHDLEMFWAEYRRYGAWRPALEEAEQVFSQQDLGFEATEPETDDGPTPTERLANMMGQGRTVADLVGANA